jgi:potassium-transporting ATPase KdpC subunit
MRRSLLSQFGAAIRFMLVATIALGVAYPLLVTGFAQVAASARADGSLVSDGGEVVGSHYIGQSFTSDTYFHGRPSSIDYDSATSSGSNLGPTNPDLLATVDERVAAYRERNGLDDSVAVPVDAVTASGSGLDPHISPANARLQMARVAVANALDVDVVAALVARHTERRPLGILGDDAVNVLELNIAIDRLAGRSPAGQARGAP